MSVVFGLFFSLPFIGVFTDTRENAATRSEKFLTKNFYSRLRISKKIGKNYAFCTGAVITIIGITAMSLVSPGWPIAFMYIPPVIVGAGLSAGNIYHNCDK